MVEQDVPGAVGTDEVGIGHADHIDALGGEPFQVLAELRGVLSAHRCLLGRT
jgi:hypothetical protein